MSAVQPQFDIVEAARISAATLTTVAQNFWSIISPFYREDVQPLVAPPLDRLGRWLMVDPDRIQEGEHALKVTPPPKVWNWTSLSIILGLDNSPNGSLVRTVSRSNSLISSFLLLAGSLSCFKTEEASLLMHELMRLNKILKDYDIPLDVVVQFANAISGCREYLPGETAIDVYNSLAVVIEQQTTIQCRQIEDLNMNGDIKVLAHLIYETITRLQDAENSLVVLRGTRHGLWLASLFVWLRPNEVELLVRRFRIYPTLAGGNQSEARLRLSIRLEEIGEDHFSNSTWTLSAWTETEKPPVQFNLRDSQTMDFQKQHSSPLGSARCQLSTIITGPALDSIGHLAAALIMVSTESGYLTNRHRNVTKPLIEVCSHRFLNAYNNMVAYFGWEGYIDSIRLERTATILKKIVANSADSRGGNDDMRILEDMIYDACCEYAETYGQRMLLDPADESRGTGERTVIQYAIHIAAQGLLFAFCAEIPKSFLYRPLDPFGEQENTAMLCSLLRLRQHMEGTRAYGFWDLRKRTIEALVPGAPAIQSADLAVAANGYIAYSAPLADWDKTLTDRRSAVTIRLCPGPLKAVGVEGKLSRLTEDFDNAAITGRLLGESREVKLYDGDRCYLDERAAKNELDFRVVHLWKTNNAAGPQKIHMASYMQVKLGQGTVWPHSTGLKVPANWEKSIDAMAFANHIERGYSSPMQLQMLAQEWERQGHLGEKLQWCVVGRLIGGVRCVTVTSENEQLRFFEAGNFVDSHRVFVKHRSVSLFQCIKVAMESCREDELWVIIA